MLTKLKALFTKQAKSTDGKSLPDASQKISECYARLDVDNRWQGDIYSKEHFNQASLPNQNVPYWMLVNRTCQLYQGEGRTIKLKNLNFIAVLPLFDFVKSTKSTIKDKKVKTIVKECIEGRLEGFQFLPAHQECGMDVHLIANFNLIHTFQLANTPKTSEKILQLSSPFCEHVFQRLSRYFYTVGFEDQRLRDNAFIMSVANEYEELLK